MIRGPLLPSAAAIALAAITFVSPAPILADDPATFDIAQRFRRLEEQIGTLRQENEAMRAEIAALKEKLGVLPARQEKDLDLSDVEIAPQLPPNLVTDVVPNQAAASSRSAMNPDISAIGTFAGQAGDRNPFDARPSLQLEETEIGLQAFVDPYAQAKLYVAITPDGAEMEEGFVSFIALPSDFTAKAGKLKAAFGKVNLMHTHVRPWVDHPLVIRSFFGEEGLNDSGISVSRLFPNRSGVFVEGTAEVFSGHVDGVFESESRNDLIYLGHLKAYRDLSERNNLEVGASWARGTAPEGGRSELAGIDVTYRYKPLERSIYRSFVGRAELISNRRDATGGRAFGYFASADYQLARRWFAGVRIDRAEHPDDPSIEDRGESVTLTFWPSEFSQFRAQGRRIRYGNGPAVDEILLQLQFSIGAHGAHTF